MTPAARKRARTNFFRTIAGVLAVTTATLFGGLAPASAAVGDSSSARGQLLSGSLIGASLPVTLQGAQASSNGTADDLDTGTLSLAVLSALQLQVAGGVQIDVDGFDAGVLDQYAEANADGTSLGASGAVANDGAIGIGPSGPGSASTALRFNLAQLLGGVVNAGAVSDLDLELGAISAQAVGDGVSAPTGDYEIAGLKLVIDSPAIEGVSAAATTAVNGVVNPLVTTLSGTGAGSVRGAITAALPALTLGVIGAGTSVNVNLASALNPLIGPSAPPLGAGSPIEIDLGTGVITVDVRALLASDGDPGHDLNSLDPNTEILSAPVLALITAGVENLLDDLADDIAAAVTTAVLAATVALDLSVSVPVLGNVATIHVGGTVSQLIASTPGAVTVTVLNNAVCALPVVGFVCTTLDATVLSTLDTLLTNATSGLVTTLTNALQAQVVVPVLNLLNPALTSIVTGIVSLRANVQEPTPPLLSQEFVETALRLTLIGRTVPGGGVAVLNLAQAAVGPNAAVDPVASDLDPDTGPETGGTVVTISGSNIGDATGVTFGGTPGTGIVRIDDDTITVVAPAHVPGSVGVVVTGPGGSTAPLPYLYYPVTTITDITPDQGPEAGGTTVVITGHCFTNTTSVTFGGDEVLDLQIDSDTQLTVVVPAGVGLVDVVVTASGLCGAATAPDAYAYVAPGAPDITGIVPDNGPETGGTFVTLTGTGFTGATGVTFGGSPGTTFTVVNDTTITAFTPVHAAGPVNVVVVHPAGNSAPETFTYLPVTTITDITPDQGPELGGTQVVITGHCFLGATGVTFGGVPATNVVVDSDTQITATVPAGTGIVDVTVIGAPACGDDTVPGGYEYLPSPVAISLVPPSGPETGGTLVTITGTDFTGSTGVTIGGVTVAPANVTFVNDTTITFIAPPHVPGSVPVVVLHPVRNSDPLPFVYTPVTRIFSITPDSGPEAGGNTVVITGQCFTGATQVLFGTTPATSFVVVNSGRIDAVAPAGVGLVDVTVNGAGTCGNATEDDGYAFVGPNAPVVTGITPPQGPDDGGTLVTITGTRFTGVTSVTFDGIAGTSLTVISDTQLTVVTPPHVAEVVDVVVSHPLNGDAAPVDFEYIQADVGGVTETPGSGVLGLTGSSPWTGLFAAIQLLLVGLALVAATSLRRRRRLL